MRRLFFALLSGGLFGAGLFVSGMVDTRKVQGWLDVFGDWDPTLGLCAGWGDPADGDCLAGGGPATTVRSWAIHCRRNPTRCWTATLCWGRCCLVLAGVWRGFAPARRWPR